MPRKLSRTFQVAGTIEGAHEGLAALEAFARDAGLALDDVWPLHVALDEWLTNVARHAYGERADGVAEVRVERNGREVVVDVADEGPPFDPLSLSPPDTSAPIDARAPGGLGVYFLRRLMTRVSYRRDDGRNVLTFAHTIPPRGGQTVSRGRARRRG